MSVMDRSVRRVRHELRLRLLDVMAVRRITPRMVRVALGGDALHGFVSASYDDHVKLFLPLPGQHRPVLPVMGENGPIIDSLAPKPVARDYTPRRYDPVTNRLEIDVALHGDGPASNWAASVEPGHAAGIGGPRGSFIVPDDFDWYLLAGDETALPAIGRRLEELPAGSKAIVLLEVADQDEEQVFESEAELALAWLHRDGVPAGSPELLEEAMAAFVPPPGEGYAWIAAESAVAKSLRLHWVDRLGLPAERIRASGYWRRGAAATHDTHQ